MHDHVLSAIIEAADARLAEIHRLQIDQTESLLLARHDESVAAPIELLQQLHRDRADQKDRRTGAALASQPFQSWFVLALSGKNQLRVGKLLRHLRPDL